MIDDPFNVRLSALAAQHGQAFFCDPTEDEPPCADCAALFTALRQAARAPLLLAVEALVTRLHREAREAEADGDFCCGETRRHDANQLAITIGPYRPPEEMPR